MSYRRYHSNIRTNVFGEIREEDRNIITRTQKKEIEAIQGLTKVKFTGTSYTDAKEFIEQHKSSAMLSDVAPIGVPCARRDCDKVISEGDEFYETKLGKHCSEECWLNTASELIGMELKVFKARANREPEPDAPKYAHIDIPRTINTGVTSLEVEHPNVTPVTSRAKSRHKGVYPYDRGRWRAEYYKKGKRHYVGVFDTIGEAVEARKVFIAELEKIHNGK